MTRDGDRMRFALAGGFDGEFTTSLVQSALDGDGLADLDADTSVLGRYACCAVWTITTATGHYPRYSDAEITDWRATHHVWGSSETPTLWRLVDDDQ